MILSYIAAPNSRRFTPHRRIRFFDRQRRAPRWTVHHDFRFRRRPRNGCSECREDFASVDAFDRHRVGDFNLDWWEGENGRHCLDPDEMQAAGLERDRNGRWQLTAAAERARRRFEKAA